MIETYTKEIDVDGIKEPRLFTKLVNLHMWEKNPFGAGPDGLRRLAAQIDDLGTYKPIVITAEGTILAGNKRFAYYKQRGDEEVWITVVHLRNHNDELKINISDNDQVGFALENELANLLSDYEINDGDYGISFEEPTVIADITKKTPAPADPLVHMATCPNCGTEFNPKDPKIDRG